MIIFVGDKPSAKNINPDTPFVGTQSYKRFLAWIGELDIYIGDAFLCNIEHVKAFGDEIYISCCGGQHRAYPQLNSDKFIALGNNASTFLMNKNIPHFKLDHPSGLNRKLNDKKYEQQMIRECKKWLEE